MLGTGHIIQRIRCRRRVAYLVLDPGPVPELGPVMLRMQVPPPRQCPECKQLAGQTHRGTCSQSAMSTGVLPPPLVGG